MPAVRRKRPKPTRAQAFVALFVVFVALPSMVVIDFFKRFPVGGSPTGAPVEITIPKGAGPLEIGKLLQEKNIIDAPSRFALWLRVSGRFADVRAGTFSLRRGMSPDSIAAELSGAGLNKGIRITVPEGFALSDIGALLEKTGLMSSDAFKKAATDPSLMKTLGIPFATAEGFLFPDTYYFSKNATPAEVVDTLHRQFLQKLSLINAQGRADRNERIILASIVEAEARFPEEAPIIAGIYLNRLDAAKFPSRRLQADPTVAYGCNPFVFNRAPSCATFKGTLGERQLDDDANPYNTYRHEGLPPGPVCAPSLNSLKAAFAPASVPYLYFVAGQDGHHRFATTLDEHNSNVKKYRQGI